MSEIGILALRYACGITAATQNALKVSWWSTSLACDSDGGLRI